MFLTGYDTHDLLRESAAVPTLAKPAGEPELVATVGALVVGGNPPERPRRGSRADCLVRLHQSAGLILCIG
jgi:hypothetical protein